MSFGGSQGQIRYQLIVDDAGANAKIGTFKNSLTSLAPATQQVNQNMGALANNFKGTSGAAQDMIVQHNKLGSTIKTNITNFSNLAIGLSSVGTSVLNLAAGFRDYNDAQIQVERVTRRVSVAHESLQKAQTKLNDLQSKGIKSGKEYQQAQLDVQQAQQQLDIQTQLLGESQERLFDSQSQFVVSIVPTVLGAVGSLGAAFQTFGGKMGGITDTLGKLKGSLTSTQGGFSSLGTGMIAFGAIVFATAIIDQIEKIKGKLKEAGLQVTQTSDSFISAFAKGTLSKFNEEMKQSAFEFDNLNKVIKETPLDLATKSYEQLRKEVEQAGGTFDKSGKLMEVQKERVIDLGAGFNWTSVQYIKAAENMIRQDGNQVRAKKWLIDSHIQEKDVLTILKFAQIDANKTTADGTKTVQTAIPTIEEFNQRFTDGANDIGLQSEALDDYVGAVNQTAIALAKYEQSTTGVTNANQDYYTWFLKLAPEQQQYIRLLEQGNKSATTAKLTAEDYNAAINYQNRALSANGMKLENVASQADEVSAGINEVVTVTISSANEMKTLNDIVSMMGDQSVPRIIANMNNLGNTGEDTANRIRDVWQKTVDEFKQTKIDVASIFGFDKKFSGDKVFKDMVKDLPSKLEKELKGTIKANFKIEETETGVKKFIESIITPVKNMPGKYVFNPDLHMDKKKAIEYGKDILKQVKDIPAADTQEAAKKLADAIGKGDWGGITQGIVDVLKTLNTDDMPPIPVKIVASEVDTSKYGGSSGKFTGFEGGGFSGEVWGEPKVAIPVQGVVTQISGDILGQLPFITNQPKGDANADIKVDTSKRKKTTDGGGGTGGFDVGQIQTVQKALQSLATYGIKNLQALAKAATTNFNTVANYAKGAMTNGVQPLQTAIQSLTTFGGKNIAALAKSSKTNFNTVANYASGAMTNGIQPLQVALDSLTKYGVKNMSALAKSAKTNFNTVANYANGATTAVQNLQSAVDSLEDKSFTVTMKTKITGPGKNSGNLDFGTAQEGMHTVLNRDTMILAHKGERVDIGPINKNLNNTSTGPSPTQEIHIHNHLEREVVQILTIEKSRLMSRMGPI